MLFLLHPFPLREELSRFPVSSIHADSSLNTCCVQAQAGRGGNTDNKDSDQKEAPGKTETSNASVDSTKTMLDNLKPGLLYFCKSW